MPLRARCCSKLLMSSYRCCQISGVRALGEFGPVEQLRMHLHHENLFVVRAVEDADHPAGRQRIGVAPQVVV